MGSREKHTQAGNMPNGAAVPAPKVNFESLDFEEVENTVYRADHATSGSLDSLIYSSAKWGMCFAIGVCTAIAAFAVNIGVENISGFKFWAVLTIASQGSYFASFLIYAVINAVLVTSAVALTVYAAPAASGSGIAEVKAYLNGIDVPGIFYFNTLCVKILGAVGGVAGGLAIGKEGPFVHAGACIAAILSQGGTSSVKLPVFKRFWNDRDRIDMVPVGGVLFALEEMMSWCKNQILWQAFFTTAVVSVSIRVLMKACSTHGCGFFGSGGFIIFKISEGQDEYEFYELLPMLLLGVVGGLLGSAFIVLNARLAVWRKHTLSKYGRRGKVLEGLAISVLTSVVSFGLPLLFECQGCPIDAGESCPRKDDSHSGNFVTFGCRHPDEYHGLGTLFFNTQDDAIRNLFSTKTKREYTILALITFTTVFFLLAVVTYGISCPTGLFVPSILCGAAYGRLVGIFVADMHPNAYIDEGTYALLGAASFLGGSMRMTVCTCVMLLELTNNLALLPLIMLVLLVAKAVGDGTGVRPLYEFQMAVKDMPFMPPEPEAFMKHITARECCGKPTITLQRVERVSHLMSVLRSNSHNGFPVTQLLNDSPHIVGVITRHQLLVLLGSKRCLQSSAAVADESGRASMNYGLSEFSKPICSPQLTVHDVHLSLEQLDCYLDLGPHVNPSCYVVQEDTSLSKTIEDRFRGLGQYTTNGNTMNGTEARSPAPGEREGHTTAYASSYGFLSHRPRPPPAPLPTLPRNGANSPAAHQHIGLG
ncbi:MAG: hypothetical protein WDW38_005088 [Sanguina aurantia]